MGKRNRSETNDYESIAKKVKKLNEKLMRAQRKYRQRTSSSSSESDSSSTSSRSDSPRPRSGAQFSPTLRDALCIEGAPGFAGENAVHEHSSIGTGEPVPSTSAAGMPKVASGVTAQPVPSSSKAGMPTTGTSSTAEGTQSNEMAAVSASADIQTKSTDTSLVLELNEDLLKILGEDPSKQKKYGKDIQADLAIRLEHIATSGLPKEARKILLDKYLPPANCPLVDAPALNPEVKAAIPDAIQKRDKAIEQRQKQLSSVTSCLAEAITTLMVEAKNTALIQLLMDASKLLCDAQYCDSLTRRNFVLNNLKKDIKDQLQATKIDKLLFSEELSDALKAAKAISKSSADMKLNKNNNNVKKTSKPTKNWKAPPPNQGRPKGNQRTKEPAYKNRESSLKQSSHPAQTLSRRR